VIGRVPPVGRLAVLFAIAVATGAPVWAQTPALAQSPQRERDLLTLQMVVNAASTEQARGIAEEVVADVPQLGSTFYVDITGSMRLSPNPVGPLSYSLTVSSAVRRYESGDRFVVLGHAVGGSAIFTPTGRTSVSASGSFSYVPSYSINVMPLGVGDPAALAASAGTLPLSALDFSLGRRPSFGTTAGVSVSQGLTRRLSLSMYYLFDNQEFEAADDPSFSSQNMAGRLGYSLTRDLSLMLGYGRRIADFQTETGTDRVSMDDIDAGLSFARGIGLTKTTRLSFSTGSTIRLDDDDRRPTLTGAATLTQTLGRRGALALSYLRGGELKPGFGRPVFSDSANLSGTVAVTDRITFAAASTALFGESGRPASADNKIESMSGFARLSYRVFRRAQIYADYLAYRSNIDRGVDLVANVPRDFSSHTVRAGLSWTIPLVTSLPPRRRGARTPRERN
jgi:hypothetical protein